MAPGRVDFVSGLHKKPNPGRVHVTRPVWVHHGHTDLVTQHEFLLDFGFQETHRTSNPERIFYKGYNDQPVSHVSEETDRPLFFGGSLEAASQEDLERAAKLPGAVFGYSTVELGQPPKGADAYNRGSDTLAVDDERPRRGRFQRTGKGRPREWYQTHFNIRALDVQANALNKDLHMAVFYDIDLGKHYRDHHAFFHFTLFPGQKYAGPHHASYVWDIGMHILGSQIFDYWYDPSGFAVEHYIDGDIVNEDNQPERAVNDSMAEFQAWSGPLNTKRAHEGNARPEVVIRA
ncbi:hypothetical protein LA080_000398 [Diaporthe eres]|nr:hypothetical protein LA080_000398 [Diaporthe eres]